MWHINQWTLGQSACKYFGCVINISPNFYILFFHFPYWWNEGIVCILHVIICSKWRCISWITTRKISKFGSCSIELYTIVLPWYLPIFFLKEEKLTGGTASNIFRLPIIHNKRNPEFDLGWHQGKLELCT